MVYLFKRVDSAVHDGLPPCPVPAGRKHAEVNDPASFYLDSENSYPNASESLDISHISGL